MVQLANISILTPACCHPLCVFILKQRFSVTHSKFYKLKTHPIHHSQVHPHVKGLVLKVDPLGQVGQQLVVERLNPIGISALIKQTISTNHHIFNAYFYIHDCGNYD